jgi:NAD(P)-dependent dehydrogenase (short-subunit alcohol dehydrogenase family)
MVLRHIIDLSGKTALITGGSRGLGREIALAYAAAGANIIVASRNIENCKIIAKEVKAIGRKAMPIAAHIGHWEECDRLIDEAYREFSKIDILVNNAGKSPVYNKLSDIDERLYDTVLDLNLKGPFRLSSVIGERMAAGDGGSIINISSFAAIRPRSHFVTYAAAKAGMNAITEAMAEALGPKVRVNCIMPGPFLTDVSKAWDMKAFSKRADDLIALKRAGKPEEIVGAALYLASEYASFTTASIIRVDGGSR